MVVTRILRKNMWLCNPCARRRGYTLVELIVVIGVVLLLVAILMPALNGLRESARAIRCQSNLRQLGQGFISFAADHEGVLPGSYSDRGRLDPSQRDWLQGSSANMQNAPAMGSLFNYVGQNAAVYRCPSLDAAPRHPNASNGVFDYTFFLSLTGARLGNVRPTSRFTYPDRRTEVVRTPLLTEEDPWYFVNRSATSSGAHVGLNQLAHTHRGRCFYACVDGGVASFNEPTGANASNWTSQSPSGKLTSLGADVKWGWWNRQ